MMLDLTHAAIFCTVNDLGAFTLADLVSRLAQQRASDDMEASHLQQECNRVAMIRIGAQHEAVEMQEMLMTMEEYRCNIEIMENELKVRNPEQDPQDIKTLERKLQQQKRTLHDAESIVKDIYSNDEVMEMQEMIMNMEDMDYSDNVMIKQEPQSPDLFLHTQCKDIDTNPSPTANCWKESDNSCP
jgi:hypothetical protein